VSGSPRGAQLSRAVLAIPFTVVLTALAVALSGCETTAEKSAKLEKAAKHVTLNAQQGLTIAHPSKLIKVTGATLVHGSEGTAAVITLRNNSPRSLSQVPISIALKDAKGATLYSNGTPGLAKTLTTLAMLPAHGEGVWIDDQIPRAVNGSVTTEVGEGTPVSGSAPRLTLSGARSADEPNGATVEGTISNGSKTAQSELVIYAIARSGSRILAAGRAVLASLEPGASAPFQIFFIGSPKGGQLKLSAPPTSLG
jgi:hypothetical protein